MTNQLFQFALGYLQTPPDTSPEIDPLDDTLDTGALATADKMGSFLFKWYVRSLRGTVLEVDTYLSRVDGAVTQPMAQSEPCNVPKANPHSAQ